jgi:NAD+ kinase
MTISIYTNYTRDPNGAVTLQVSDLLRSHGVTVNEFGVGGSDFIVALGGDGTILRIAPNAARLGVPILGINLGGVGYLAAIPRDELNNGLERFLNGNFTIEPRMMLDVSGTIALNEVVIHRGETPRPILLTVSDSATSSLLSPLRGDGLIAATPTGSTAYSQSAGGIPIDATLNRILVTPICARRDPIVLDADAELTVTLTGEVPATLTLDGGEPRKLHLGDSVHIKRSELVTKMVKLI